MIINKLCWLASVCACIVATPAQAAYTTAQADILTQLKQRSPATATPTSIPLKTPIPITPLPGSPPVTQIEQNLATTLLTGINVGDLQVIASVVVRGQEDGEKALDFANWLVPYETVLEALKFTATNLPNGQIELRSPGLVTSIAPSVIRTDVELGKVFSIADIDKLFGVKAEFDINQNAIVFQVPWFNLKDPRDSNEPQEPPVILTGLPRLNAPKIGISSIQQRVNLSGEESSNTLDSQGELSVVGTFFGGSTYFKLNQSDLTDRQTWTIREAQFLRQTGRADYIVGTQAPFWLNQVTGEYVGFTTIQRRGFVPTPGLFGDPNDTRQRLQTNQFGRTIEGDAAPGTLVRLTEQLSDRIIAEVLVDSTGRFRFTNIPTRQTFGGLYRVLLYPNGQLTALPEIRDVSLSAAQGQLPVGASALLISGGLRREESGGQDSSIYGDFSDFRGGIARRWRATESLTFGVGAIYDKSVRGMGEVFFQPQGFPLQAAVSVLSAGGGENWIINSDILFTPSPSINARFNSTESSNRFDIDWEVFPGFSLLAINDSNDSPAAGFQFNFSGRNSSSSGRAILNTEGELRWSLGQRLGQFGLRSSGSEVGTQSELLYELSGRNNRRSAQFLALTYETRNETFSASSDNLAVLGYGYRSRYSTFAGQGNRIKKMR